MLDFKDFQELEKTTVKEYNIDEIDMSLLHEAGCVFQNPEGKVHKGLYLLPVDGDVSKSIQNHMVVYNLLDLNVNCILKKFPVGSKEELLKLADNDIVRMLILYNNMNLMQALYTLPRSSWSPVLKKYSVVVGFDSESE